MSAFELPPDDFDENFGELLTGVLGMFPVKDSLYGPDGQPQTDVDKVLEAEQGVKEWRTGARGKVDQAREDLKAVSREYQQTQMTSQRSSSAHSAAAHEAQILSLRQSRLAGVKTNSELETQQLRLQGELERLQQELKEEEADAVDAGELNSEVLRLKLYRDMGFTPVEENGNYTKIIVRSQVSKDARTVQLDPATSDFKWSEFLWDMMFSQGAASTSTPRQSRRLASRASRAPSALASGQTTPRGSPPQTASKLLGSNLQAASRALAASPAPSSRRVTRSVAASDVGTAMDVEEGNASTGRKDNEKVLVKDDKYAIMERTGPPDEVVQAIAGSDPYTQPVKAVLDPVTGFALLVSSEFCFVWNWTNRTGSTTTYVFPVPPQEALPSNVTAYSPLSFASLVPSPSAAGQREPGFLLSSNTGALRYWDTLSLALSGVDRFKTAFLPLNEGELVRELRIVSPTTYLASTSQARIFAVSVVSTGGRADLSIRPLERQTGWAGSLFSAVFGSGRVIDPRAGILALAVSPPRTGAAEKERTVYAVMEKNVQVWTVPARSLESGGERLVVEQDIFHAILVALAGEDGGKVGNEHWALNSGKVEVLDAATTAEGELVVLVSHVDGATQEGARSFAVIVLQIGAQHGEVQAKGIVELAYQARPDPRPLSTPRLHLGPSDVVFVTFADAVVLASLDSPFEESFPLRSSSTRIVGTSLPAYISPSPSAAPPANTLFLLTSTSSTLSVSVVSRPVAVPDKTRKLQTRLEQAVFFGSAMEAENPLSFDLQPGFEGDLAKAAVGLSAGILASSSPNMPLILDLRAQLSDRVHRARALVEFINANGLLGKLPQATRRQLSWDAERLSAAVALWHHQNARLGAGSSPLSDGILTYMDEIGEGFGEDPLRLFFRTKIAALGPVLEEVSKQAKAVMAGSSAGTEEKSVHLQEANQIVLLAYNALTRHRADTPTLYGLDPSLLPSEPWSSRPALLEPLQWLFDATDSLLRERVRDFGANVEQEARYGEGSLMGSQQQMQVELKRQMESLAEFAFSAFEERLLFLATINGDATTPDQRALEERYLALRPRVIRTLVSVGAVPAAFQLAEKHRDFVSLVELANDPSHGSRAKVNLFLDTYAEEFAFPLYQFYQRQGQLRTLLEPLPEHRKLLTSYLDATDNDKLAWINDIAVDRFEHGTEALSGKAVEEPVLAQKKLMLSLSKLTRLASIDRDVLTSEPLQRALETVDDALDLVNSQSGLQTLFASRLSGGEIGMAAEEEGEAVVERVAPALGDRPAFAQQYAKLAGSLFAGRSLTAEDLIDLFALKENVGEQSNDFATALDVLVRAKDLPAARKKVALENIWRRVYIQDDWASLKAATGLKDEEMAGALRSTAFYATLAASAGSGHPPSLYLEASQTFSSASTDELAARYPTLPPPTLDLLLNDYEQEGRVLSEHLQHNGLEQYCKEIVRMLQEGELEMGEGADDSVLLVGEDSMMSE
ncbi:hypothetical protein JCM11641_008435 [Rhodosporidiobolus odoratus]